MCCKIYSAKLFSVRIKSSNIEKCLDKATLIIKFAGSLDIWMWNVHLCLELKRTLSLMNIPITLSERLAPLLPVVCSFPSLQGSYFSSPGTPPVLRFLLVRWRSSGTTRPLRSGGVRIRMAWSLRDPEVGFEDKVGNGGVHEADERHAQEAVEAVKSGKVIAVPTDTLYGFACDACSLEAVNRIYEIKGRKHTSPLAICVGDVSDIDRFAVTDYLPNGLLDSLLPGPVTVILRRGELSILEKSLNPGLESIGVRVPDCNFIRMIARGSGSALALTSANLSGKPSSVSIKDFENLWEHCAFVYDGGVLPSGRAGSTIVDLTKSGLYRILRPGSAMEETVAILEKHSIREETTQY